MTEFEQNQRTADLICHDFRLATVRWFACLWIRASPALAASFFPTIDGGSYLQVSVEVS